MKLFIDVPRAERRTRQAGESQWAFFDRCDRPEAVRVRNLMENWFAAYPEANREHLRGRLMSKADEHFRSAFFELYVYVMLRALGLSAEVPRSTKAGEKTEDFRVYRSGELVFRLEAKYVGQEAEQAWQDNFEREVERALQKVACGRVWFRVRAGGSFDKQPNLGRIVMAFEQWYKANSAQILAGLESRLPKNSLPCFEVTEAGVRLEVRPLCPKAPEHQTAGPIGAWSSGARWMRTDEKLRKALKAKASRYGPMDVPFVVAAALYESIDDLDVGNALFGDEVFLVPDAAAGIVGQPVQSRKPNGFWFGPHGPQNTRVSAVLLVPELFPTSVASQSPILYHNPWAERPLPTDLLPLTQVVPDHAKESYETRNGMPAHELFGLEPGWPRSGEVTPT